ncbi:hypothetical protein [Absidia glauca]|uniref:C2H2-type domain-containing protein n=1 Tax=Absidia glauca TaxID=4829 RepID=A0A168P1G1_ABSGL|nr:hypothetical protein [Absidia glauca]
MYHDDIQETANGAHYDPNDYSADYGDGDEEHNAMTSDSASSPVTQHFLVNPWTAADDSLAHATSFALATDSTTAIAIATAIASPGTATAPTNIAIDLTPAGLDSFLMDDLDVIMSHEKCICSDCWCSFTRPQDLNRHRNAKHTHKVRHRCPYPGCSGRFARSDVLRRHLTNVHQQS